MENFNLGNKNQTGAKDEFMEQENRRQELNMTVSPVCEKNGQKTAYVSFSDGARMAEGEIPDCRITKNNGFDEDEAAQLELYMKGNLMMLKKMASSVNVLDAFMGKKDEAENK